jgi:biofilm PGA synthesis N-glycosyltransferase PgaC
VSRGANLTATFVALGVLWAVVSAYVLATGVFGRRRPVSVVRALARRWVLRARTRAGRARRLRLLPDGTLSGLAEDDAEAHLRTIAADVLLERRWPQLLPRAAAHRTAAEKHARIHALRILASSTWPVGQQLLENALVDPDRDVSAAAAAALPGWDAPAVHSSRRYLTVAGRFWISIGSALAWASFSIWLSTGWIASLARPLDLPLAVAIVAGIAIIPGYLNLQLLVSLLLDRPKPLRFDLEFPKVALIVAAYNEEEMILRTLSYAQVQDYEGELEIVVADDGSDDTTAAIVDDAAARDPRIRLVRCPHGGKARALNAALGEADAPLVATIDADTLLMPWAVRHATARLLMSPPDTVAVAGCVLVQNSRANLLTRVQEWDYFLGISSVKRQQALWQGTLVAQGAFSVYRRDALVSVGGWPDKIGEDIVVTWAMMRDGGRITFEPTASGFTAAPADLGTFVRQRQRWARGMIEGLRDHGRALLSRPRLHTHAIGANLIFPFLDGVYTLAFLPGIALAFLGHYEIAGPMTLIVLPINLAVSTVMLVRQKQAFDEVGLRIRRNLRGFSAYMLLYTVIVSPIAFSGYLKELTRRRRVW